MRMKLGTLKRIIREAVEAAAPVGRRYEEEMKGYTDEEYAELLFSRNADRTIENPYLRDFGPNVGSEFMRRGSEGAEAMIAKLGLESGAAAYDAYRKREDVSALANVRGVMQSSLPAERIETVNMLIDNETRWGNPNKETVDLLNANKSIYQKYLNNPQIDSLEELTEEELAELEADADQLKANDNRIEDITHESMMKFSPGSAAHRKYQLAQNRLEAIESYLKKQRQMQGQAR